VNEKDCIENDIDNEEKRWENAELLIGQVTKNVKERDMLDAFLLVKAAGIETTPADVKLDLWGQAIDIAFHREPKPEELPQWLENGVYFARKQLLCRVDQLKMDPRLVDEEPQVAIVEVYGYGSPLYNKYKTEAFRVAQLYYYYNLINIAESFDMDIDGEGIYTIGIGVQVINFAYLAGCYHECLELAKSAMQVYGENDLNDWLLSQPVDFQHRFYGGLYLICYNAAKAAQKSQQLPGALDWAIRAESYTSSLEDAGMISEYFARRGEILLEMGQAEEALTWLERAIAVPGLTKNEVEDAKRRRDIAKQRVTGDNTFIFDAMLDWLSRGEDKEAMKQVIESVMTGNEKPSDLSKLFDILEKSLSGGSLEKNVRSSASQEVQSSVEKVKEQFFLLSARTAVVNNNLSYVESIISEIEKLAEYDSDIQLNAAFFLVRFRQEKGERITWESISPLISRLFNLPGSSIVDYFLDLSAILLSLEEQELSKASTTIAALLKEIRFDNEDEKTPAAVIQQTAFSTSPIDAFFTSLVLMSEVNEAQSDWWLEHVSRFKYISSYRGQRLQKEAELFKFSTELPEETVLRIENTAEDLTRYNLEAEGTGSAERRGKEIHLMTLLYPMFNRCESSRIERFLDIYYPEIIHIEAGHYLIRKNKDAPVISVSYDNYWRSHYSEGEISVDDAVVYREFLIKKGKGEEGLRAGVKLQKVLLPVSAATNLPTLLGVRSTGIYHSIPLDSLPLPGSEEAGEVTGWMGEYTTSVLLTGPNKDLEMLEKQLNIEKIAVFSNSALDGNFPYLVGVQQEASAIEEIVGAKIGVAVDIYRESDANRHNFLKLSGTKAPHVLHIAAHGIADEEYPSNSFIVLSTKDANDRPLLGAVGYHDIMLMDLRQCDLVVLSACSTHEGKSFLGEGIMGLAWAFKAAGVKAVIGTRWRVNDKAAVAFWSTFYENLCSGLAIGKAFHDARLHIMKQEKWKLPYYWGVFQLIV
jgi:tetratricopeptide (TPR) repeat protein